MMPGLLQSLLQRLLQSRGLAQIIALLVILAVDRAVSPQFFDLRMQDGRLFGSLIDVLNRGAPSRCFLWAWCWSSRRAASTCRWAR